MTKIINNYNTVSPKKSIKTSEFSLYFICAKRKLIILNSDTLGGKSSLEVYRISVT